MKDEGKGTALSVEDLRAEASSQAQRVRQKESDKSAPSGPTHEEKSAEPVGQSDGGDYAALLESARVRPTDEITEPPVCLSVETNGVQAVVGTAGNFSVIIGAAKVRKTFMTAAIAAAALNPDQPIMGCLRGHLQPDKPGVLVIDTEQGRYHVLKGVKRICLLCGLEKPKHLHTFALRQYDTRQRIEAIRYLIETTPGIGLVILDGARDIVFSINNEEEATATATMLLQLTEQYGIHLLTVLHTNKGANADARGHLGAELINKAETVIRVSKDPSDKGVSVVTPEHCRDRDFEPFAFSINEQGLPYRVDEVPGSSQSKTERAKKPTVDTMSREEWSHIIKRTFSIDPVQAYGALLTNIIEASEFVGLSLAKSRAEMFVARVTKEGYLTKSKARGQRHESYQINAEKLPNQLP